MHINATMLDQMLATLQAIAGTNWHRSRGRTILRIGPDPKDAVIYHRGEFRTESTFAKARLADAHLEVQNPRLSSGYLTYRSLRSGDMVTFKVTQLEMLRTLDPKLAKVSLGPLEDPKFNNLEEVGLVSQGLKASQRDQATLSVEACDAIQLLGYFLEASCR